MGLKQLLPILGYFFLLGLGIGNRLADPQEIVAQESWRLFATPPPKEVTQGSILGVGNAFHPGEIILPIIGDMLLAPVNQTYALPASYVPPDLTIITGIPTAKPEYLRASVLPYLHQLYGAAKQAGYSPSVVSAYRSYATQVATFNYWANRYGYRAATRVSALPGHSEHQLGTAVDLGLVENPDFESFTSHPVASWIAENSHKFGFVVSYPKGKESITGYIWEPWHIRWVGIELATQLYQQGLTLEEYLSR